MALLCCGGGLRVFNVQLFHDLERLQLVLCSKIKMIEKFEKGVKEYCLAKNGGRSLNIESKPK